MKRLGFDRVMDGKVRRLVIKDKVNGYRHIQFESGKHMFVRGDIAFVLDNLDSDPEITKRDYANDIYLDIDYSDIHKFADIEVIGLASEVDEEVKPREMNGKEFKEYLDECKQIVKDARERKGYDDNMVRCLLIGRLEGTKRYLFSGQQLKRIFDLSFKNIS